MNGMNMKRISAVLCLLLAFAITPLTGCGDSASKQTAPLSAKNINLVFVVSPDLAYDPLGDINPNTANLNNQGLQRSLLMGTYLKNQVLGKQNVNSISALEPMTHLQTVNNYPDMAAIGFIQQFALLNKYTFLDITANSHPIHASYGRGSVPVGVYDPQVYPANCRGLTFDDAHGDNIALVTDIINANAPGFYVFSAPWETTNALLVNIKKTRGYNLNLPTTYKGSNHVYAISITPSGDASLVTYNSNLNPPASYPVLPSSVAGTSCSQQTNFTLSRTGGINGAVIPANINTNETVYLIRHAEAHPVRGWDDGNYIGAGQWRALALPDFLPGALHGQRSPTRVYSIDPAQSFNFFDNIVGLSYVRPSLTVLPYAIANNLPYDLAANFSINENPNDDTAAENTFAFFFTHSNSAGVNLSNQTVLLAWEHEHYPPLITKLLQSYGGTVPVPTLSWPSSDYDTIWTVTLDASGNVTVHNALCEGIDSASLPPTAPQF